MNENSPVGSRAEGSMIVNEIRAKTILSVSKIDDYALNPYVGCAHACTYCYARFMKRFTGHKEPWGDFVDVKVNAPDLLLRETGKKRGTVWVSGVCDPYQPLERQYRLTRRCLEILLRNGWPVRVQTRSPLVLRDLDILREAEDVEVGLTVTTADDTIRRIFEPNAPAIARRLVALEKLRQAGIRTYAMIAPMLPGAETLVDELAGRVDHVLVDRLNYAYANTVYRKHNLEEQKTDGYFRRTARQIVSRCREFGIPCRVVY
jgi:DNA repair photolyase